MGVVKQAVRGHVAAHAPARAVIVVLHVAKHLLQGAAVEEILQLGGAPLGIHGAMRRLPILAIATTPLALEALRVAAVHPELGLFEVDRLGAGIERALDALAKVFPVVGPGAHVIDIAAVTDLLPVPNRLGLVLVVDAVKPAVEVVLIRPPRDARHDVDAIAAVTPSLDALWQVGADAVAEGHIRTQIGDAAPRRRRLEASTFQVLLGVSWKSRWTFRRQD